VWVRLFLHLSTRTGCKLTYTEIIEQDENSQSLHDVHDNFVCEIYALGSENKILKSQVEVQLNNLQI
jgi:hypothetical protein